MTDFLTQALAMKRERLAHLPARSLEQLRVEALEIRKHGPRHQFRAAISRPNRLNLIAEIKPLQNVSAKQIPLAEQAMTYNRGGAAALSVWTEEDFFHGSLDDLRAVRAATSLPILCRDFILEPCQVYQTAIAGADALQLTTAALDEKNFAFLRCLVEEELGLDALAEVHSVKQLLSAHALGATIFKINDRNLHTPEASFEVLVNLARQAPANVLLISEDKVRTGRQLRALQTLGYKGFLIRDTLTRTDHPEEVLRQLLQSVEP